MIDVQFAKKDEIAQADIFLALEDYILSNMKTTYPTFKKLWDRLNRVYKDKSLIDKIYLWRQLYNLKIKDKVSIYDHLNELNSLLTKLMGVGILANHLCWPRFTPIKMCQI